MSSGAAVESGLSIVSGDAIIFGSITASQVVTFWQVPSGVLELDNLAGFAAEISGMSQATQQVDLGGFTFSAGETVSWAQTGTSGTLTVVDGAKVAGLSLIGTFTASNFALSDDGHGGTFVADPRAATAAGFAQAIASLPSDSSAFVGIDGGGTAVITSPAFVTAATSGR